MDAPTLPSFQFMMAGQGQIATVHSDFFYGLSHCP
jgi:hypothetical protein